MEFLKVSGLVLFLLVVQTFASMNLGFDNKTSNEKLSRNKRFLVFTPNGGVLKFVAGYLGPIDIPAWQNINCMRNVQFQYDLPQKWATSSPVLPGFLQRSETGRGFSEGAKNDYKPDKSRQIAYQIVEDILNKEKKNGHECLLRTICEVAETSVSHNGLVGELLQLFFTPGKHEKLHEDYLFARKAGLHKVNCEKLYPDCPFGHGILDTVSLIQEYKLDSWLNF